MCICWQIQFTLWNQTQAAFEIQTASPCRKGVAGTKFYITRHGQGSAERKTTGTRSPGRRSTDGNWAARKVTPTGRLYAPHGFCGPLYTTLCRTMEPQKSLRTKQAQNYSPLRSCGNEVRGFREHFTACGWSKFKTVSPCGRKRRSSIRGGVLIPILRKTFLARVL